MLLSFLFCWFLFIAKGQINHVPNPSFELLTGYNPTFAVNSISVANSWDSLKAGGGGGGIIPSPTINFGGTILYQTARTGNFMAGANLYYVDSIVGWRSYIQAALQSTLVNTKSYCVTAYFNLFNRCQYATDQISLYFDNGSLASVGPGKAAYANPQIKSPPGIFYSDTLNWMKVQGSFTANGTESYITIGNFRPQASLSSTLAYPSAQAWSADYYIDDVSVIDIDLPAYAAPGPDIWAVPGTTTYLGRPSEIGLDDDCTWFKLPNTTSVIANVAGFTHTVAATTETYMVKQDICGMIKYDTVVVHASGVGFSDQELTERIRISPNPTSEDFKVELIGLIENELTLSIINNLGQKVFREKIIISNGKANVNISNLCSGSYFIEFFSEDKKIKITKKLIISN